VGLAPQEADTPPSNERLSVARKVLYGVLRGVSGGVRRPRLVANDRRRGERSCAWPDRRSQGTRRQRALVAAGDHGVPPRGLRRPTPRPHGGGQRREACTSGQGRPDDRSLESAALRGVPDRLVHDSAETVRAWFIRRVGSPGPSPTRMERPGPRPARRVRGEQGTTRGSTAPRSAGPCNGRTSARSAAHRFAPGPDVRYACERLGLDRSIDLSRRGWCATGPPEHRHDDARDLVMSARSGTPRSGRPQLFDGAEVEGIQQQPSRSSVPHPASRAGCDRREIPRLRVVGRNLRDGGKLDGRETWTAPVTPRPGGRCFGRRWRPPSAARRRRSPPAPRVVVCRAEPPTLRAPAIRGS
jgi:hypothetical protein